MRQYGTVSPLFWTGKTGRKLRADRDSQVIALYLMTNPHSHQTGLYYLPLMYLANEVGIPTEGARKALLTLAEDDFCRYDEVTEWVWVCEMAAWQIGTDLKDTDKRALGVQQYVESAPLLPFTKAFIERYKADFHLRTTAQKRGSLRPSKGLTPIRTEQNRSGTGAGAEGEHEGKRADAPAAPASKVQPTGEPEGNGVSRAKGARIPDDFALTPERAQFAQEQGVNPTRTHAQFCDFWRAKSGAGATKLDWDATWRNWCRKESDSNPARRGASAADRITWRPTE
jgi:hypothetical protein